MKWQQLKLKDSVMSGKPRHNMKLTWSNIFVSGVTKNFGLNREHWITWIICKYRLPPLCIHNYPLKLKKRRLIRCQELNALCCGLWCQKLAPLRCNIFCSCFFTERYKVHNSIFRRFSPNCEKAAIRFVMSVCSHGTVCSHWTGFFFSVRFDVGGFLKICRENFIKIWE